MADQNNPYIIDPQVKPLPIDAAQANAGYQSTAPKTVSGVGGKTEGIAFLADKFFAGMSQGRQQQFMRGEMERAQLSRQVSNAYQRIDQSDLAPDEKAKLRGQLDAINLLQMKQDTDKSPNKDNPQVKMLKHAFEAMMGPGAKKYEFGPEQVYQTLTNVYSQVGDPTRTSQARLATLDDQFIKTYNEKYPKGASLDELSKDPDLNKFAALAQPLTGGKYMPPGMAGIMDQAKAKQDQEFKLAQEAARARATKSEQDRILDQKYYRQANNIPEDAEITEAQTAEGHRLRAEAGKPATKKQQWVTMPDGKVQAVWVDPSRPGVVTSVDTGKVLDQGSYVTINPSMESAKERAKFWGEYGNFYRAALGEGLSEEQAKKQAGDMVYQKYNVTLGNTEQQMGIRYARTDVGAPPPRAVPPKTAAPPSTGAAPTTGTAPPPEAGTAGTTTKPKATSTATPPATGPAAPYDKASPHDKELIRYGIRAASGANPPSGDQKIKYDKALDKIQEATGLTSEDITSRIDNRKANQKSLERLNLLTTSTEALENALDRHATILQNLRARLPQSDITRLNELLTSGAVELNIGGMSDAAAQYAASLQAVRNEYARVISGGSASIATTPVESMKAAGEAIRGGLNSGNMTAVLDQLRREATQKIGANKEELQALRQNLKQDLFPELYGKPYVDYTQTPKPQLNTAPPPSTPKPHPPVGTVKNGYRFKGGDPGKEANWEKVATAGAK